MSDSTAKGFKVPKIRRQESKDNLRTLDLKSRDAQEISDVVSRSYLERSYTSPWELKTLHLVDNKELEESYRVKKAEMKDDGRHSRDLADQYAFLLFRDSAVMAKVIKQGLVARQMPFNALGASKFGVYLCRNADVQLRLADGKGLNNCTLVVFKITLGKCKTIAQQNMTEGENIEPTPNYDCHVSQVQARPTDSLYLQLARSQVFLYEYTDECIPSERPRQCLPYAILSYEKRELKESSETTSAYGKQSTTSTPSAVKPEQTTSDSPSNIKRTVSYSDSTDKIKISTISLSIDTTLKPQQHVETPLQANVIQTEVKPRDPRLARTVDSKVIPTDPRLRSRDPRQSLVDPRLNRGGSRVNAESNLPDSQSFQGDQRLQIKSSDARSNIGMRQAQNDPRTGSFPPVNTSIPLPNLNDPRFKPLDPRLPEMSQNVNSMSPMDSRLNYGGQTISPHDPRIKPSDPRTSSFPQSTKLVDPRLRGNSPSINMGQQAGEGNQMSASYQPSYGPPFGQTSQENLASMQPPLKPASFGDKPLPRDPRLRKALMSQEINSSVIFPVKSSSDTSVADHSSVKFQRKKLSIDEYKKKVEILVKQDESNGKPSERQFSDQVQITSESVYDQNTESVYDQNAYPAHQLIASNYGTLGKEASLMSDRNMNKASDFESPSKNVFLEKRQEDIYEPYSPTFDESSDQSPIDSKHDEVVTTPYMMMQTLSSLSEPDESSMSPQRSGESSTDDVENALTVAIRKLVEQSPDMAVLTQAIQVLGQTHDMKDILEALKKAMISSMEPSEENIYTETKTPGEALSKEVTNKSPLSLTVGETLSERDTDTEQQTKRQEQHDNRETVSSKVKHVTEAVTDIPLPQIDRRALAKDKNSTVQENVQIFLSKEKEEVQERDFNLNTNERKLNVKESPSIGFSPSKSLLSGAVDNDGRFKAAKQLFQTEKDETKISIEKKPIADLSDPSALDRDERLPQQRMTCLSPIFSLAESAVAGDVDERKHLNIGSPQTTALVLDVDERSHSRSLSPVRHPVTKTQSMKDIDERSSSPSIPYLSNSFILDVDERKSHSRSQSPVASKSAPAIVNMERIFPTPIMSPDPETSDSIKDELQNKNNNFSSEEGRNPEDQNESLDVDLRQSKSENEFGDVDWRWTAASEMGDVDLRAKPGKAQPGNYNLPPALEAANDFWTKRENKEGDLEFRELYGSSKSDYQQGQPAAPYESYSTNDKKIESYESSNKTIPSYSTTGNVYGEYSTSNKQEIADMDAPSATNYPPFQPPSFFPPNQNYGLLPQPPVAPQQPSVMNFNNLLGSVNLDLANLKNILATVQKPVETLPTPKTDFPVDAEEEEVTSNLPAFVTGLCKESPKKDPTLTKYTGKPREWVQGRKSFVHKEEENKKDPLYDPTRAPQLQRSNVNIKLEEPREKDKSEKYSVKLDRNFEPVKIERKSEPVKMEINLEPVKMEKAPEPVKLERKSKSVKPDRKLESKKTEKNLEPVKLDRNFEPIKPNRNLEPVKLDRNFEPIKPNRNLEPVKLDRNFEPIKLDRNFEPIKLDRNFEPIPPKKSAKQENPLETIKDGKEISLQSHSDKKEKENQSDTESKRSEIIKLIQEDRLISKQTFKETSVSESLNRNKQTLKESSESQNKGKQSLKDTPVADSQTKSEKYLKESSGTKLQNTNKQALNDSSSSEPRKRTTTIFAIGDLVRQVRETSDKSIKKAEASSSNSPESGDHTEKIFSLGDTLKRMRESGPKNTNESGKISSKRKKKSSPPKESSKGEKKSGQDEQSSHISFSNMTPYQRAIMESLETSDLTVKHDNSVGSEKDIETPKRKRHNDSISKDLYSDINRSVTDKKSDEVKNTDKSWQSNANEMDLDNMSDNSDDEHCGLIIDLGETPAKKAAFKVKNEEKDVNEEALTQEKDDESEQPDEADDCLVVEMETQKAEVVDLTEDDHDLEQQGMDDTEMNIRSRGQMETSEDDPDNISLVKRIKTEKMENVEREKRLAEEAKLAEAFGDSELDIDEPAAAQRDKLKGVVGPQARKKIVINLKSTGKKAPKKVAEDTSNKDDIVDDKTDSKIDKGKADEKSHEKTKIDLGPVRTLERLGQRNLSAPRTPSPITVLGTAPQRVPSSSPHSTQQLSSGIAHKPISSHNTVSLHSSVKATPPTSQPWSNADQQTIQSVNQVQFEGETGGNLQAIPNLSQICSIPPPNYRSPSPVNQMVPVMSSVPPVALVARTMQNLQTMIASNMVPGISVPMPPVRPVAALGVPPFQPNMAIPPPNINAPPLLSVPPPILTNQPPPQSVRPFGGPMSSDVRQISPVQVVHSPANAPFPNTEGNIVGIPGRPPNVRPIVQGNLTIPVIGQTNQSQKDAMMQDVLQRVRQRVPTSLMSHASAPPVQGMRIQTIGQATTGQNPPQPNTNLTSVPARPTETKAESQSKNDVLDWFSDKFGMNKEPQDHSTQMRTMEGTKSEYSETLELHESESKRLREYRENDGYGKKPRLTPSGDNKGDYNYEHKLPLEQNIDVVEVLQQHSVENLNKAKDVILQSLASLPPESGNETEIMEEADNSDLEEGECSEDSSVTGSPLITEHDNRRVIMQNKVGNNIQVLCAANNIQRIQTIGTDKIDSPKRIVKLSEHPVTAVSSQRHKNLAAEDWSDMLQRGSQDRDIRENRTSAFKRLDSSDSRSVMKKEAAASSPLKAESDDSQDSAGILASSAALLSKTKNKLLRGTQVKTLGDWLKLELEIENIQPLQKYIPYAFNTDLTAIPKGRRRKIKTKVRTVLEKEGKASAVVQKSQEAEVASQPKPVASHSESRIPDSREQEVSKAVPRGPPINPSYLPEVPNVQIQSELELVKKASGGIKDRSRSAMLKSANPSHHFGVPRGKLSDIVRNEMSPRNIEPGSEAELQLIGALQTVETEMVTMLQRTYFYGYPHRRVPKDLLLESEMYSFKSPEKDIFLILMMPLSIKPYNKLKTMKKEIEALMKRSSDAGGIEVEELKSLHNQREQVLRAFTGYLNKKRIAKIQDLVNKYTMVYDYFKALPHPPSDSAMKFIRTTQIDLRQHLILAKQYLAMDEKKLEAEVGKT